MFFVYQSTLYFVNIFQSEEEGSGLQKKIQQIEAELDAAQEQLAEANAKLEAKEKAAADVSYLQMSVENLKVIAREHQVRFYIYNERTITII